MKKTITFFIIEIDECYYEMKVSNISRLRDSLIRVVGCRAISVHLVAVGTGSLVLSFCYCFDDYIDKFHLTPRQLKSLAEVNVCRITSLRDKDNQFVYNDVQSYKILPLEYGVRQAEQSSVENIRFRHRIIRTLSVVEQLDLEISGTQLQLLLPFKNIPDTEDAEIQTLTNGATEINQPWQSVSGKENEDIRLSEVVNHPLKSWNYSNKETGTTNRRREIVSVIETLDLEVQNRLLFPSHLAQEEKEAFLQTMTELKSSVMRKEGELIKLTHEMEERNKQIKEKEEEALLVKDEANNLQKELKLSQDSVNTYQQLSFKKTMELENMKKQIKDSEGHKHSLEKKIDEEAESFKVSLKPKEEEIDRYELKLREEREKNTKIMAQLPILEKLVQNEAEFYRAHTFYEQVSRNRWIFRFVVVRHLKIHIKYVVDSFSSLEKAEGFRFQFKDRPGSSDCSIILRFTDEEEKRMLDRKWHVEPYSLPCEICKEDVDIFGIQEMSLQETQVLNMPMCMISLYCDDDDDVTTHLRYAVPVEGIKEKKTIYLMRHTQDVRVAFQDIHHEQTTTKTPTCTTPDLKIDCKKLKEEIQRIFNQHFADLNQLLKNNIQVFADLLFRVHLISDHVKSSPSYDAISYEVMSAMNFQRNPSKLVSHTVLFLKTMSKLGPPQQFAATSIADELTECINENLKVQLAFTW